MCDGRPCATRSRNRARRPGLWATLGALITLASCGGGRSNTTESPPTAPSPAASLPLTRLDCSNKRPLEATASDIAHVQSIGIDAYISEQLAYAPTQYTGFTWRPGLVPTRRHWPPSCLICRHSLRQRSVSSSPSPDDRRVRGGSRVNSRCERPDCLSRGRDGRVGIWRHFGSLATATSRSQIVEVTLRAWR